MTAPADPRPVGFRLESGWSGQVTDLDPRATPGFTGSKSDGKALLAARGAALERRSGCTPRTTRRDGCLPVVAALVPAARIMRHVWAADPQGVDLTAFKAPTAAEKVMTCSDGSAAACRRRG